MNSRSLRSLLGALTACLAFAGCSSGPMSARTEVLAYAAPPIVLRTAASDDHCLEICPAVPAGDRLVRHTLFTLANNSATKFADWVAYVVREEDIGPNRPRRWHVDPDIPADETLEPQDYDGAARAPLNYQMGHQAPLASFGAAPAWAETNDLSNITPQIGNLNGGRWSRLENAERVLARRTHRPVYVVTGPLYEHDMAGLPHADEPLRVPSGYWKIVSLADGRMTAFIFENRAVTGRSYCQERSSVAEVSQRAGFAVAYRTSNSAGDLSDALGCASEVG